MSDGALERLRRLFRSPRRIQEEVDAELRFHLEQRIAELRRQGWSEERAREEALRRFGDLEETRAVCFAADRRRERNMERREHFEELRQDLLHGWRQLRRRPGFAGVAILTLAVGIGANTAVFSAADHVLLRPLPYRDADRVVTLWETAPATGEMKGEVSPGNFVEWEARSESFASLGLAEPSGLDLTGDGPPIAVPSWRVTEGFFAALGVRPLLGRTFRAEEFEPGGPRSVLISYGLWQRRYAGDAGIVGGEVELDGEPATVIGVLPPELEYPEAKDVWAPKAYRPGERTDRRSAYMYAVGRLRSGVSPARAQADLDRVAATLAREYPETNDGVGVNVVPLEEQVLGDVRPALLVLLGAVGFVLVIACANVAGLLLARGAERERELGVRAALGAGRARLARQLVTESALLAVVGGVAGTLLAWLGVQALTALIPPELPRAESIAIDGRVLIFAAGLTLFTAVLFGLLPALRLSRPDLLAALQSGGRSVAGGRGAGLRGALVVGEIALALVLLIGAGLLGRSFLDLLDNDPGFVTDRRAEFQVFLWDRNRTPEARLQRVDELTQALRATAGVEEVGVVMRLPFHPVHIVIHRYLTVEGRPAAEAPVIAMNVASPEYFEVMGIPLRRGRPFTAADGSDAPPVALISETLARRVFPEEDPVGRRAVLHADPPRGAHHAGVQGPAFEIVGIVGDVRPTALNAEPRPVLYYPYAQSATGTVTFVVRTLGDPGPLLPTLRQRVWDVDPGQTIYHAATLSGLVMETVIERRFHLALLGCFAVAAVVLAAIGIYGLVSFSVNQRTREIGIRIALGARRAEVVAMVLRQGLWLGLPGIGLGAGVALLLTRFLEHMLYGVTPTDFATFAPLALLMLLVAGAASYVPARRAASADPAATLREE